MVITFASVSRDRSDRMFAPRIEEGSTDGGLNVCVVKCYIRGWSLFVVHLVVQENLSLYYFRNVTSRLRNHM